MSSPNPLPPPYPHSDPGATVGPEESDPFRDRSRTRTPRRRRRRDHGGGPFLESAELGAFGPYGERGVRGPSPSMSDQPRRGGRGHRHGGPSGAFDPAAAFGPAFGPGFGRRGGPGGGRGRGPRPRRGDVRLAILRLLAVEPMHGYQIITELAERSGGVWRPSPGSVYPTLQVLADEGLVVSAESDGRRVFTLTDDGRAAVTEAESHGRRAPWDELADDVDGPTMQLRERLGQVMGATVQVAQIGTTAQVARAERILTDTRKALYRLLAEDDESPAEDPAPDAS